MAELDAENLYGKSNAEDVSNAEGPDMGGISELRLGAETSEDEAVPEKTGPLRRFFGGRLRKSATVETDNPVSGETVKQLLASGKLRLGREEDVENGHMDRKLTSLLKDAGIRRWTPRDAYRGKVIGHMGSGYTNDPITVAIDDAGVVCVTEQGNTRLYAASVYGIPPTSIRVYCYGFSRGENDEDHPIYANTTLDAVLKKADIVRERMQEVKETHYKHLDLSDEEIAFLMKLYPDGINVDLPHNGEAKETALNTLKGRPDAPMRILDLIKRRNGGYFVKFNGLAEEVPSSILFEKPHRGNLGDQILFYTLSQVIDDNTDVEVILEMLMGNHFEITYQPGIEMNDLLQKIQDENGNLNAIVKIKDDIPSSFVIPGLAIITDVGPEYIRVNESLRIKRNAANSYFDISSVGLIRFDEV